MTLATIAPVGLQCLLAAVARIAHRNIGIRIGNLGRGRELQARRSAKTIFFIAMVLFPWSESLLTTVAGIANRNIRIRIGDLGCSRELECQEECKNDLFHWCSLFPCIESVCYLPPSQG